MTEKREISLEDLITKFNSIQKHGAEIINSLRREPEFDSSGQKLPFTLDDNERKKIADTIESLMTCFSLFKNLMSQQVTHFLLSLSLSPLPPHLHPSSSCSFIVQIIYADDYD
jgi:hypothetical protein